MKQMVFESKNFREFSSIQFHENLLENVKGVAEVSRVGKV